MIEKVRKLIENKQFEESYNLIEKYLKEPFELSNAEDCDNIIQLKNLKDSLLLKIENDRTIQPTYQSNPNESGIPFISLSNLIDGNVSAILKNNTEVIHCSNSEKLDCDVIINILIENEILHRITDPSNIEKKYYEFFHKNRPHKSVFIILDFNDTKGIEDVEKYIGQLVIEFHKQKIHSIGVRFIYKENYGWEGSLKFHSEWFFSRILGSFMFQTKYLIYVNNLKIKKEFERILENFRIIKFITYNSPKYQKQYEELCQLGLTDDKKYKNQLKAISMIIDRADIPILITGQSGVGKTFLAKVIHSVSDRKELEFVDFDCVGMPATEFRQKFFGTKKGSYTDSKENIVGKVVLAKGGTIFIDEIDRVYPEVRDILLKFIESKEYQILGDPKTYIADVRLIFGSNKDFNDLIKGNKFESDFYARIMRRKIHIPALRERKDDIDIIISSILSNFNDKEGTKITIGQEVVDYLKYYDWPYNVRQLTDYIEDLHIECVADGLSSITLEKVKESPPENHLLQRLSDFEILEKTFLKLLAHWDSNNGGFLDEIISPILAKVYIEDCLKNISHTKKLELAKDIVGIRGSDFSRSPLVKAYEKYSELKNKF